MTKILKNIKRFGKWYWRQYQQAYEPVIKYGIPMNM